MIILKKCHWITVAILVALLVLGMAKTPIANAQETPPPPDTGCVTCHEDLYYLHDTGKWYCLCAVEMSCTCCHGGNPESLKEEEAHAGMVALPINEQAATCQNCHPQDYSARAEKFASVAGISTFHPEVPTPVAVIQLIEVPEVMPPAPYLSAQVLEPWRLVGLGLLAMVLVILIVLGYRCWKADCLAKMC